MKILVMTRHAVSNYGSFLQALATRLLLEDMGHAVTVADYLRADEHPVRCWRLEADRKEMRGAKRALFGVASFFSDLLSFARFKGFRQRHLTLSPRCTNTHELALIPADLLLSGSDQLWGPVGKDAFDPNYFLDFGNQPRVAYSSSFGRRVPEDAARIGELLRAYDALGVRENSAVEIVRRLSGREATQVLDPVLMLERERWAPYFRKCRKRPFVLLYSLHNNPDMARFAKEYAARCGLPLVKVTTSALDAVRRGGTLLPHFGKFLALIDQAECMITDSFHGTAFAIDFHTDFIEFLPGETATRNQSLLQLVGLESRIVTDADDFRLLGVNIDFSQADAALDRAREISRAYLERALSVGEREVEK